MALQKDKAELGERLLGDTPSASPAKFDEQVIDNLFSPLLHE
jgi:hypothetical protein